MNRRLPFGWGVALESGLLLLAAGLAWAFALPLGGGWRWSWATLGWGVPATVPMLLVFAALMRSELPALRQIRGFIERVLCPALAGWTTAQLLAISALAGVAEEVLFRAVLQGGLEGAVEPAAALVLASTLFGLCHWITPAYALVAGLMGLYLGGLWWWSGNLLVPVIAHGLYDFIALLWVLRRPPAAVRRDA